MAKQDEKESPFTDFDVKKLHFICFSEAKRSSPFSRTNTEPLCGSMEDPSIDSDESFSICFTNDCEEGTLKVTDRNDCDQEEDLNTDSDDSFIIFFANGCEDSILKSSDNSDEDLFDSGVNTMENAKDCVDNCPKTKKIQFDTRPPVVHVMRVWSYAARKARESKWEVIARDRWRFKQRIDSVAKSLNPILMDMVKNQTGKLDN